MADAKINVGDRERTVSLIGGAALAVFGLFGLSRKSWSGALPALIGGELVYRGLTGNCPAYTALGVSTAATGDTPSPKPGANGIQVRETVTVGKPAEELYGFWRDFTNLPKFMNHLASVEVKDSTHSHWVAAAPLGRTVAWDARIINERANELIAWQTEPGADIASAGSVNFKPAPGGRGTEIHVVLNYNPPAGAAGAAIAKLLGEEPQVQIAEDLRRFKNLMETGETPTVDGQPIGERPAKGVALDKLQAAHAA